MEAAKAKALSLVNDHSLWTSSGPWLSSVAQLLEALDSLSAAQAPFSLVDSALPFAVRAARLQAWCASHPAYSSSPISLCGSLPGKPEGTRGVTAAGAMAQGTPIVCVPVALALSTDTAYQSWELGPLLDQPKLQLGGMVPVTLAMHLLVEHAKACATPLPEGGDPAAVPLPASAPTGRSAADIAEAAAACAQLAASGSEGVYTTSLRPDTHPWGSPWRAFLACLPSRVPNCLFWSARHYARLAHTRVALSGARFLRNTAKVYLTLHGGLSQAVEGLEPAFTWAAFRWAQACCMSRQNQLPSLPGTPRPASRASATTSMALLPIFDMLNHCPQEAMPFFTPEPWPGLVTASLGSGAVQAGAELSMNYGPRPAGELLMHQGFLTPLSLQADAALLTLTPPAAFGSPGDALFPIRTGLLEKLGVHWSRQGMAHFAALAQSTGQPPNVAAARMREEAKWAVPMDFPLRQPRAAVAGGKGRGGGGGVIPPQAWALARVLLLERKDAPVALRALQEAMKAAEQEARAVEAAAEQEASAAPAEACCSSSQAEAGAGGEHGHSHSSQQSHSHSHSHGEEPCTHSHGHGHGHGHGAPTEATAAAAGRAAGAASHGHSHAPAPAPAAALAAAAGHGHSHDGGATQCQGGHGHGSGAQPAALAVELPVISPANERAARDFVLQHLRALKAVAQASESAAREAAGEQGAVQAEDVFIQQYLESQARLIELALAEVVDID